MDTPTRRYEIEWPILDVLAEKAFMEAKSKLQIWYEKEYGMKKPFDFLDENSQSIEDWMHETRYLDYWQGEYLKKMAKSPDKKKAIANEIRQIKSKTNEGSLGAAILDGYVDVVIGDFLYDYYEQNTWTTEFHIFEMLDEAAGAYFLPKLEEELMILEGKQYEQHSSKAKDSNRQNDGLDGQSAEPVHKIRWNGENTQLVYLIEQLKEAGLIADINLIAAVQNCFLDKNGKPLKNLHQSRNNMLLNDGRKPKRGADKIEGIVKAMKGNRQ